MPRSNRSYTITDPSEVLRLAERNRAILIERGFAPAEADALLLRPPP